MNNQEKAKAVFNEGFSCSQAVLAAFCQELNLDKNTALKIADSFGGGMGRLGLTCGAVTGALLVIGLKYGRIAADDQKAKQKTTQLVRNFIKRFEERNATAVCRELLGCDISTEEGFKYAKEHNLINTRCPDFVACAVGILDEIL